MIEINMLSANSGDCFHISIRDKALGNKNIIVDSGIRVSAVQLERVISNIEKNGEVIDLLIVTHTDKDHIGGLKRLVDENRFKYNLVKEFWINDGEFSNVQEDDLLTAQDGRNIIDKFQEKGVKIISNITTDFGKDFQSAIIRVLSPTIDDLELMKKEWKSEIDCDNLSAGSDEENGKDLDDLMIEDRFNDDSNEYNNASITFQILTKDSRGLFLADASSKTVLNGLKQSKFIEKGDVDFIKVPHHGSKMNISKELLKTFKTENYILSTNGSRGKPHKLTIARMLSESVKVNLFCNYCWWTNQNKFTMNDHKKYIQTGLLNRIALTSELEKIGQGVLIKND
jgi:beta-lactamase superfamily II metal-dependent hydrolase